MFPSHLRSASALLCNVGTPLYTLPAWLLKSHDAADYMLLRERAGKNWTIQPDRLKGNGLLLADTIQGSGNIRTNTSG
jgi:hypothetical protein